jgi:PadR family transcriptional regulator, regulatory protein AphA
MVLRYAILGLLSHSPMTGYYLGMLFDRSLNFAWTASLSQIYRELSILEKEGFVTSSIEPQSGRPDKKIYTVTAGGGKAFMDWLKDFPDVLMAEKRDEFMIRTFFGARLGKEALKKQFLRFIEERDRFKKGLKDFDKITSDIGRNLKMKLPEISEEERLCIFFMVRRAQMSTDTLIEWAEECVRELDNTKLQSI